MFKHWQIKWIEIPNYGLNILFQIYKTTFSQNNFLFQQARFFLLN